MAGPSLRTFFRAGLLESVDVLRLSLERRVGEPARADIEVIFDAPVDPDELLGAPAEIAFGRDDVEHTFQGVVAGVTLVATPDDKGERRSIQRLHVTSLMALLEHDVDCRIFQDNDVKEIVSEVLRGLGVDDAHQSWKLVGSYPKREYCVQYNESSLAFVSRLLEEEGIYYTSSSSDDGEVIVFEDDSTLSDPIDGATSLPFRRAAGLSLAEDAIGELTERRRKRPGKVVLRDYDFKKPQVDLTATAEGKDDADLEVYDYPGLFTELDEGNRLARVRLEALTAERFTVDGKASCPRLLPGRSVSIVDAAEELDGEYFVVGVLHEVERGVASVSATMIPKTVKHRSPLHTPRPVIHGPQTAEVVAPEGSPLESIHTDKHGRCKVKFHWDRYGNSDDTASCWMRVAQPQTSGSMVLPRVGWEVIVEFLEGNPDRPLVTGRVFNGRFMPPYALPEGKSRTAIQSASSPGGKGRNEIRFEDKAGSEEVKIQSQKDTTLATANNKTKSVGANETKNVKVDATLSVGANQTTKITNGYKNTVGGAQSVSVGGNRKVEVNAVYGLTSAGASSTSVGGNQMEMAGNPIQALLSLAVKMATEAAQAEAARQLRNLDKAVASKVNQMMGPIANLQNKVAGVGAAMDAVSKGDFGAAAGALGAAAGLPTPSAFGAELAGLGGGESSGGGEGHGAQKSAGGGGGEGHEAARGADGGGSMLDMLLTGGNPAVAATRKLGIDSLVHGAIDAAGDSVGEALGLGGGGGGGASAANKAGPEGAVGSNSAADSATGPGHAVNVCSATHTESVGSVKATIAAAGIHTTIKGARTQNVGAVRVELVGGTRAETCLSDKTEKAIGLVVLSGAPESEMVGRSRTTMVGGAILEKIGASHTVAAGGKAMFVGAFHKVDASSAIVFKCGDSEVVIDGGGVTIKSTTVTISAPKVTLTKAVSEA
ncbi:MAG TPA: type VI secretion system tip protein TssI/VgrG [Polyangiaceae bacterium]|nr:type VI secretion system tip protein TssI/VgrG [Polyangiaceae bacterium]